MPKLEEFIDKNFVVIREGMSMPEVSSVLAKNRLSGAPVVNDKDVLKGYISERDIIKAIIQIADKPVSIHVIA